VRACAGFFLFFFFFSSPFNAVREISLWALDAIAVVEDNWDNFTEKLEFML
jgi:hypothetical protein